MKSKPKVLRLPVTDADREVAEAYACGHRTGYLVGVLDGMRARRGQIAGIAPDKLGELKS